MWSLQTCGLFEHVVFMYMWSLCTCDLYRHVVFIDMWSLQTCGIFEHVVFMYMWFLCTCGLYGFHITYKHAWSSFFQWSASTWLCCSHKSHVPFCSLCVSLK